MVNVNHWHAINGRRFIFPGSRVHHVIGADDDSDVDIFHAWVNLVHFQQLVIGDVGLCQQHVHMPRHTTCDGMNTEANFSPIFFQQLGQLFHHMLSLSDRHTVTWNNGHGAGGFQNIESVFSNDGLNFAFHFTGFHFSTAETGKQYIGQGTIHGFAHDLRQDDTGSTDQSACHDQNVVVHCETRGAGG